jgi:asparagine synthetase B (glutamine-hydrolysing)
MCYRYGSALVSGIGRSRLRGATRSDAVIVDKFRQVLRDAVRQRLVADVEVASYLSGGIDSCAVLAGQLPVLVAS